MELRHLRYFVTVAQELSFTRAAQRLNMAQPPLSQQIRDLEEELGFALFNRSHKSISLTQAGRDFLPEARQILEQVARVTERSALRARGEVAELKVGLISAFATPKFASMLRSFQKANPGVRISLSDRPSAWQLRALKNGEIDVGFINPPKKTPPLYQLHRLKRESMKLAVPTHHPFAKKEAVEWRELSGEDFILVDPKIVFPDYYSGFFSRCKEAGFEPQIVQYTRSVATQIWMVSAGLGIAPMPIVPEFDRSPGVAFVALPKDSPIYETAMAWRHGDESAALKRFTDAMKAYGPEK